MQNLLLWKIAVCYPPHLNFLPTDDYYYNNSNWQHWHHCRQNIITSFLERTHMKWQKIKTKYQGKFLMSVVYFLGPPYVFSANMLKSTDRSYFRSNSPPDKHILHTFTHTKKWRQICHQKWWHFYISHHTGLTPSVSITSITFSSIN